MPSPTSRTLPTSRASSCPRYCSISVLQTEIEQYRGQLDAREVGRVLEVGDGIARVYGLSGVMAGEMVDFKRTGVKGLAFNLEENSVGVIILGEYLEISEGDEVCTTGQL